jgi:hypothetical protein
VLYSNRDSKKRLKTRDVDVAPAATVDASAMHLASLNVDVLLHLIEFVNPVDRYNLVLSGILKGFENLDERIDLRL